MCLDFGQTRLLLFVGVLHLFIKALWHNVCGLSICMMYITVTIPKRLFMMCIKVCKYQSNISHLLIHNAGLIF